MALVNTDLLLVNRGDTSTSATVKQIKDYVLKGISSDDDEGLVWVNHPATKAGEISASPIDGDVGDGRWGLHLLTNLLFGGTPDMSYYNIDDTIVLINMARGNGCAYKITGKNTANYSISISYQSGVSVGGALRVDDRALLFNLGPQPEEPEAPFEVIIQNDEPAITEDGLLWWQPFTGEFFISYNNTWFLLNGDEEESIYDTGPYYKNAIEDLGCDPTGVEDCSGKITTALIEMFDSVKQQEARDSSGRLIKDEDGNQVYEDAPGAAGTLYFPAGTYLLQNRVTLTDVGSKSRATWVIKGDGQSTKFYCDSGDDSFTLNGGDIVSDNRSQGAFRIITKQRDNYITFEDMMIVPKQQINGTALYLQNGNNTSDGLPSGGSNQQYGAQIINVSILSDDPKPTDMPGYKRVSFFKNALALINYGRPRLSRVICWNHSERSSCSWDNPRLNNNPDNNLYDGEEYWKSYGFKPEEDGKILDLSNCYSPWVDTCYFNGVSRYGVYWNSTRGNTEGGTFTKCVINGGTTGFHASQYTGDPDKTEGRHPHLTLSESHVNSTETGVFMDNVKYFDVSHVLFYARTDRRRSVTHYDVHLRNCISGTLANGYSGGRYSIDTDDETGEILTPFPCTEFQNLSDPRQMADARSLAPHRVHVLLEGVNNVDGSGTVRKNRNIAIQDTHLNAYMPQTDGSNRTVGQRKGSQTPKEWVSADSVDWNAVYEVRGPGQSIDIVIPDAPQATDSFDGSVYPPYHKMVTSDQARVNWTVLGEAHTSGVIDSGDESLQPLVEKFFRQPLEGQPITTPWNLYVNDKIANDLNRSNLKYFTEYYQIIDNNDDTETGRYSMQIREDGVLQEQFILESGVARFPYRASSDGEQITFSGGGAGRPYPSIYMYISGGPNARHPDATVGSLSLGNDNRLWFKTSSGWKEVQLK